jgi:hypothetical protein
MLHVVPAGASAQVALGRPRASKQVGVGSVLALDDDAAPLEPAPFGPPDDPVVPGELPPHATASVAVSATLERPRENREGGLGRA